MNIDELSELDESSRATLPGTVKHYGKHLYVCTGQVGWPARILTGLCAVLFFVPGLKLAGLNLSLPYWLTHLVAWVLLIGFTLFHRTRYRQHTQEAPA